MLVYKNNRLRLRWLSCHTVRYASIVVDGFKAAKCWRRDVLCFLIVLTAKSAYGVRVHGHRRHHIHIRPLCSENNKWVVAIRQIGVMNWRICRNALYCCVGAWWNYFKCLTIHLLKKFIRNSQYLEVGTVHRCIASPGTSTEGRSVTELSW